MPYGTARPSPSPRKSWILTASASRLQTRPPFLKLPINSSSLLLGIEADDRQPRAGKRLPPGGDRRELVGAIGVGGTGLQVLGVDVERAAQILEQPPDGLMADGMPRHRQ